MSEGLNKDQIIEKLGNNCILIREYAHKTNYKRFFTSRILEVRDTFKKYKHLIKSYSP